MQHASSALCTFFTCTLFFSVKDFNLFIFVVMVPGVSRWARTGISVTGECKGFINFHFCFIDGNVCFPRKKTTNNIEYAFYGLSSSTL